MSAAGRRSAAAPRALGIVAIAAALALAGCADGGEQEEPRGNVFSLEVGDCLGDAELGAELDSVVLLPCDEPHTSEIYASIIVGDTEFPGLEAITAEADERCLAEFEGFTGGAWADSAYDFTYLHPTAGSWANGDREILCQIYDPAGPTTGSLQGAGA
ncbi:septum formation family protein [Microcella flavibacter]|uniref:septum formation family protein n=1 Tax=Microcella flavibacter TaxID=1804990 RepID=UPI0014568FB0|nr:septum formation family protein [Microcella flavibacter]